MACALLLFCAGAVEGDEQVSYYAEAKLAADDGARDDIFGASVAISGNTAVIGTPGEVFPGSAYVFERDPLDPPIGPRPRSSPPTTPQTTTALVAPLRSPGTRR